MANLSDLLRELDISSIEFKIYETMLGLGPTTVLQISRSTSIARTTVHQNIEKMLDKGLVSQLVTAKKRKLIAEDPQVIKRLYDRKKLETQNNLRKLNSIENTLNPVLLDLRSIKDSNKSGGLDIKYYSTREQIAKLYDEILSADEIRSYVNYKEVVNLFPENVDKFEQALKRGVKIWDTIISNEENFSNPYAELFEKYENFQSGILYSTGELKYIDYLIYGGKISMIIGESKPQAITINNIAIYEHALFIYRLIWDNIGVQKS